MANAVLFAVADVAWGTGVFSRLDMSGSFTPPGSQSTAERILSAKLFGRGDADVVMLYRAGVTTVHDLAYRQAMAAALARTPAPVWKGG